jgi:hypothetical protein
MKHTILIVCLLLIVASCSTSRYLLTDKGNDRYFLQQCINDSAKSGFISKTPLLVIDGHPFRYDIELKKQKLNLSRNNITQVYIMKMKPVVNIYGLSGRKGVVVITTTASKQVTGDNSKGNVLVLLEGNKISFEDMKKIDPMDINFIDIVRTKSEIKKYTGDAYGGVIVIKLKKRSI